MNCPNAFIVIPGATVDNQSHANQPNQNSGITFSKAYQVGECVNLSGDASFTASNEDFYEHG